MSWASVPEMMAYFGVTTLDELEEIVAEFDLDALLADDGRLLGVTGSEMKEALFARHEREVGHRPDDEEAHAAAVALHHQTQAELKAERRHQRKLHLDRRVAARRRSRGRAPAGAGAASA